MDTTTLQAEVRADRGKGPARRLRATGKIPAVFYGPEVKPTPIMVPPKELRKALLGVHGRNALFQLQLEGQQYLAMVKDVESHPVSLEILHADFYRVFEDREIEVQVPVRTTGKAVGVVKGGTLNVTRHKIPLRTLPGNIPDKIEFDVSHLEIDDSIKISELKLPPNVKVSLPGDLTIALVFEDKRALLEEQAMQAAAAAAAAASAAATGAAAPGAAPGAPAAAGGAAAPAAGAAAPAEGGDKKK